MTDYIEVFNINDKCIILSKDKFESRENFLIRSYFIINNLEENNLEELINSSYLYLNKFYFNCNYNNNTESKIQKFLSTRI